VWGEFENFMTRLKSLPCATPAHRPFQGEERFSQDSKQKSTSGEEVSAFCKKLPTTGQKGIFHFVSLRGDLYYGKKLRKKLLVGREKAADKGGHSTGDRKIERKKCPLDGQSGDLNQKSRDERGYW